MTSYVITVSDKGSKGQRVDTAGPSVERILKENGYNVIGSEIIPDEKDLIIETLTRQVSKNINLIITTGGTGFSKRDITPEATKEVIERETPGLNEMMRMSSLKYTQKAMLSRSTSGIKGNSLIINLPGSEKAAKENLESIIDVIDHGLKILLGEDAECGVESEVN